MEEFNITMEVAGKELPLRTCASCGRPLAHIVRAKSTSPQSAITISGTYTCGAVISWSVREETPRGVIRITVKESCPHYLIDKLREAFECDVHTETYFLPGSRRVGE